MRAEYCECEFSGSWALQVWILGDLSIANVNFMSAEHCECEFYERAEHYECEFIRAEHCECQLYESELCVCEFLREQSIVNVNF